MNKCVLIVSNDLPPLPGRAVTGAGLRMHGISEGLRLRGYTVKHAISTKRILQESGLPESLKKFAYTKSTLSKQIERASPDYILKIWWGDEDSALESSPVPVIFDLPAPRLLEDIFHNRPSICNWDQKIESFKKGVFFTCPSLVHKAYYLPLLMMSGFNEKNGLIEVLPHATVPSPHHPEKRKIRFIFGGVCWPWQAPVKGLNAIIKTLDKQKKGELKLLTGRLPYDDAENRTYCNPVPHLTTSDRVTFSRLLPYARMKEEFSKCLVGVDIMEKNLERDVSFSFRTLEYLSCGLPVITGESGEWARWIKEFNAGWVVHPEDSKQIKKIIERILSSPESVKEYSLNALRLVREVFSPEKAVEPLDRFFKKPDKRRPVSNSLTELIRLKSSELLECEGFPKEADVLLKTQKSEGGTSEWFHYRRGLAFIKLKKFDLALDEFKKESRVFPGKAETLRISGVACKEAERFCEALEFFERALEIDPNLEWGHLEKGLTYSAMGDFDNAVDEIGREENIFPGKAETCLAKGIVASEKKDYPSALRFFRTAIKRDPALLRAKYNLASLLSRLGHEKVACTLFQEIAARTNASKGLKGGSNFHLGKLALRRKKYYRAKTCLTCCLDFIPDHAEAKRLLSTMKFSGSVDL